jgi:plasmid stabilization system protein ParE
MTTYQLLISSDAEEDIKDAVEWYRLAGSGLEDEFIRSLEARLESIRRNPDLYPVVYKSVRRALLRKFPYGVFYFVFGDTVVVLACFHTRRDPKDWQKRV